MSDYIDRQKLIDDFHTVGSFFVYGDYIPAIVSRIKMQPAIEPETMPIVQELRERLERVTAERDAAVERLQKTRTVVSQENEMGNYVKIGADKICEVCKEKAEGLKAMTGCRFCPITDARKGNNND